MSQQSISAAEIQRMGGLSVYMRKAATEPAPAQTAQSVAQGRRADLPASAYAPRIPTEDEEQAEVIRWAMLREMCCPALALLLHIPNGGHRHKATAGRFKALGVKKGVPDLFLPVPRDGCHGLWIEMKRVRGGRLSSEQEDWHTKLRARGYRVEVCRGAGEAIAVLKDYLGMKA